jgi:glycosyltransferase involved in cell wall biosynthesis
MLSLGIKILILGKMPPPYFGPSVWFEALSKSDTLSTSFSLEWFNVNIHSDMVTVGKRNLRNILPNIFLYFQFRKLVKRFRPDLILIPISQTTIGVLKDSVFIWLAGRRSKVAVVLHGSNLHSWFGDAGPAYRSLFSRTMKRISGAVVLGENLKYIFRQWLPEEMIFSVPNGLNIIYRSGIRRENTQFVIRYIGNLIKAKGILEVIQAVKLLKDEGCNALLKINGNWLDQELREECEKLIELNSLNAVYEGPVYGESKMDALMESDVFVFTPNKPEGHPLVIVEALASGLPVISTDMGAIKESVISGVNGFIVDIGRPDQIADKIKLLIKDPEKRIMMGAASRELYKEKFTADKMASGYCDVFKRILNQ